MFDGVGRRRDQHSGELVNIGEHSLNGFERDCLFRNNGDGTFTDTGYVNRADRVEDGRGVSVLDYDNDGEVDVLLRSYKQPAVLLRNTGGASHWFQVQLIGTTSNRDAVGSHITLIANGMRQTREVHAGSGYLSGSSLIQHFGLGPATRIELLQIRWPAGGLSTLTNLAANQRLTVQEGPNRGNGSPVLSVQP